MKYIAITIGPIYQTFRNARQTREVWAASFLFSYLAKGIIVRTCLSDFTKADYSNLTEEEKKKIVSTKDAFILPNISDLRLFESKSGIGLFPDRIIFKSELIKDRDFQNIVDAVIEDIANEIASANKSDNKVLFSFLKKYLRIDWDEFEEEGNPILKISPYLDSLELTPQFVSEIDKNPLSEFLLSININGFLSRNYDEKDTNGQVRFESLVEISTRELRPNSSYKRILNSTIWDEGENDKGDNKFIDKLTEKEDFKNYHKYICIVSADGDKIGKTLEKITGEKVFQFSEKLLKWGLSVKDTIRKYGGVPIYIGGDDLLFFAPVCNNGQNIFDLIDSIDKEFIGQNWHEISSEVSPSLSFGLSLTYYKFPLGEAIEEAGKLLYIAKALDKTLEKASEMLSRDKYQLTEVEQILKLPKYKEIREIRTIIELLADNKYTENEKRVKAKELIESYNKKNTGNAIALKLLKHSGTEFELVLKKSDLLYQSHFKDILAKMVDDKSFLNSVGYKLRDNHELIKIIGHESILLKNLFHNVFDEKIENRQAKDLYLEKVRLLVNYSYTQQNKDIDQAMKEVFSIIRTSKFIKGLEEVKN
ncbi:Cas10/Cmr2 second palm domain-containing protein [Emticicia soli]|uniref:Type III-B CRISPR-associated protein Cas10/Cmr2 n=1 Tax=Emticicia soli TaxID=2027878 RepID=A0ABW5J2Y0_9BACT